MKSLPNVPEEMIVNRPFIFDGEQYAAGDAFPWARLGCSERRARQLVDVRRLVPAPVQNEEVVVTQQPLAALNKARLPRKG